MAAVMPLSAEAVMPLSAEAVMPLSAEAVTATRTALAAEYAAAYGYGVVGAHSYGATRVQATRGLVWHQAQQPLLRAALAGAGASVPPAEPAYELPFAVTDPASAARLAVALEQGVAAAYADLVAASSSGDRQVAALALGQCAVRATQWRGFSVPFPGLPERAVTP